MEKSTKTTEEDSCRPCRCVKFLQPRSADDRNDRNKPGRPQVKQIVWLTNRRINKTLINEFPNSSLFIDSAWSLGLTLPMYFVWYTIFIHSKTPLSVFLLGIFCLSVLSPGLDHEPRALRTHYVLIERTAKLRSSLK